MLKVLTLISSKGRYIGVIGFTELNRREYDDEAWEVKMDGHFTAVIYGTYNRDKNEFTFAE